MSPLKVLIVGRRPPPIGGVTVHVDRLVQRLRADGLPVEYQSTGTILDIVAAAFRLLLPNQIVHVHVSNSLVLLLLAVTSRLGKCRKFIATVHQDISRRDDGFLYRRAMLLALRLTEVPIVLNYESLVVARGLNRNAVLSSAFLAPTFSEAAPKEALDRIRRAREAGMPVVSTAAFDFILDKSGREIYGISEVVATAIEQRFFLLISDPSGNYRKFYASQIDLTTNPHIYFLSFPHSLSAIFPFVDCFVRHTTTDGDSVAVREALAAGIAVFATRVVSRPEGVVTYDLLREIDLVAALETKNFADRGKSGSGDCLEDLLSIYGLTKNEAACNQQRD